MHALEEGWAHAALVGAGWKHGHRPDHRASPDAGRGGRAAAGSFAREGDRGPNVRGRRQCPSRAHGTPTRAADGVSRYNAGARRSGGEARASNGSGQPGRAEPRAATVTHGISRTEPGASAFNCQAADGSSQGQHAAATAATRRCQRARERRAQYAQWPLDGLRGRRRAQARQPWRHDHGLLPIRMVPGSSPGRFRLGERQLPCRRRQADVGGNGHAHLEL